MANKIAYCLDFNKDPNFYDRVHYIILNLVILCVVVDKGAIASMLISIQLVKFFVQIG